MPKIESEKIDSLHRPCSRPAPRGKIESVRTHSEVIEQFPSFRCSKFLFLVRNWHLWSRKAFARQITPQRREKKLRNGGFSTPLTGMKGCTVDRGCKPAPIEGRHETVGVLSLISSLSFDISIKTAGRGDLSDFQGLFRVKKKKKKTGKWLREATISPRLL